ncbi:MAG: TolC family outer membrane protein [Proteobacteria bacterium]|nr:TolC family outer membrane protein [Pseudomonadota bacterium]
MALTAVPVAPSWADTLKGAMLKAYRTNPTLQAQRSRQRATDEVVPQAKSGWRPTITAQGTVTRSWTHIEDAKISNLFGSTIKSDNVDDTTQSLSIQLSQPIFRGFKTIEGTKQAKAIVEAGREQLLATEQSVLLTVADAYLSVIRDRKILSLREQNVGNLAKQLQAAQARFDAGEVTRTDVTQARARVAGAQSSVASAKAQLASSIARYEQFVGSKPGKLQMPGIANIPSSLDEALEIARANNPTIKAAEHTRQAQEHAIEVVKGDLLPEARVTASSSVSDPSGSNPNWTTNTQVSASLTVPIYEAGRVYSEVREAKHVESQRQLEVVAQGRAVRQSVKTAWNDMIAAQEAMASAKSQVYASELSLDGVTQEYLVGSRSTIDILNAQQEVTNAKITQVSSEYSYVLSSYEVVSAVGRLTARRLSLGGPYYDVEENYDNVKNKWIGTGAETLR